jgi:hypothetical protein
VKAEGYTLVCFSLTDVCVSCMGQRFALSVIKFVFWRLETQKEVTGKDCNKIDGGGWRWMERATNYLQYRSLVLAQVS